MLRIGICDDEITARDTLRLSLERLLKEDDGKVIYDFSSGEGIVNWLTKHSGELDLLFLDVELGGISGMEAAKQIRQQDTNLMLVFVTGYSDFVFDGYAVGAMDYLVKPIKEDKLAGTCPCSEASGISATSNFYRTEFRRPVPHCQERNPLFI